MYQTLGKIAILLPLLLIVGYAERAQAITTDNFDSYSTGDLQTVSTKWETAGQTGTDAWRVNNAYSYSGTQSVGCYGSGNDCDYATTTLSVNNIYSQIYKVYLNGTYPFSTYFSTGIGTTTDYMFNAGISYTDGDYQFRVDGDVSVSYEDVSLDQYKFIPVNEWVTIQIAYDISGNEIEARWLSSATTSPWLTTTMTSSLIDFNIEYIYQTGGGDVYIDDWNTENYATGTDLTCPTCTRIISTDPTQGQTIATTTSLDYYIDYYVSADDYDAGNTYITTQYSHTNRIPYFYPFGQGYTLNQESFTSNVLQSGESTSIFNFAY